MSAETLACSPICSLGAYRAAVPGRNLRPPGRVRVLTARGGRPVPHHAQLRLPAAIARCRSPCALALSAAAAAATPIAAYTTKGAWSFVSAPNLHPPKLGVTQKTQFSKLAPGYFMVANFKNQGSRRPPMVGQSGPLILDHNLQPVWFDPIGVNALAAQPHRRRATTASRC